MRAIQIALFLLCIQIGSGLVVASGIYGHSIYYESEITDFDFTTNPAQTEEEQVQASITGLADIWNLLTWGWIKQYAEPLYSNSSGVRSFINLLIKFLNSLTGFVCIVAVIEFVRNRPNVLGGG